MRALRRVGDEVLDAHAQPLLLRGAPDLELDAALLSWGTDFVRDSGNWSSANARGYGKGSHIRDAHRLRLNAYRVLLTRGRDGTVIFVPPLTKLDETWAYLKACGVMELG